MKKLIILFMLLCLVASLVACGEAAVTDSGSNGSQASSGNTDTQSSITDTKDRNTDTQSQMKIKSNILL